MKRFIIIFGLLLLTSPLFASLDSIGNYNNFILKKEMWVCTSIAFPVDISYDAFNVDYKTIIQMGSGYFIQVKPGTHTDGSNMPAAENVIQYRASGVINVVGKPAGVYEYVFVSTADGFCGMAKDEQSVVRVYLVPQLTGFSVLNNICPGTTESVNFNDFIPHEIKYFIDEMEWTISYYTLDGRKVEMPVTAGLNNVGDNAYRYTINDGSGKFKNKYSDMSGTVYRCPEDTAFLTHTVRIREGEEYAIPDKNVSFCTDILSLVPETRDRLNTNLFGYLGSSAPNGRWSIVYPELTAIDKAYLNLGETTGNVSIPIEMMVAFNDSMVFKYSYEDCMARDTFTLLTLNFKKQAFTNAFVEKEHALCRNLMSGEVELSSVFGFTAPLTSGIWYQDTTMNMDYKEMLYGKVDISDMRTGSLYRFRYDVNAAVDSMCLVQGSSTVFNLKVYDLSVASGEVKICKEQFKSGMTVDLSRYVPGLSDTGRIDPKKTVWKDNTGAIISDPGNYRLIAAEGQADDTSTYKTVYRYEVRSDCGLYAGNLYVSAVDSLSSDTARNIVICYTDDYAEHVDLFQILGIAVDKNSPSGYFELYNAVNNKGDEITLATSVLDGIKQNGKINVSTLFNEANDSETYTFGYLPNTNSNSCVSNKMKITIIVTKNVKEDSQFETKI